MTDAATGDRPGQAAGAQMRGDDKAARDGAKQKRGLWARIFGSDRNDKDAPLTAGKPAVVFPYDTLIYAT